MPIDPQGRFYIDPATFTAEDLPVIVLCDDLRSFTGWAIKDHTNGNYNHAFIMHKPGMLVSQNFTGFAENKIDEYLKPGLMLKFWRIKNLTVIDKANILNAINKRLGLPWWRRSYDFLGTFVGQFLHVKWLQNPFQEFCSEEVNDDYISQVPKAKAMGIEKPNPSELNADFVLHLDIMECIGYCWSD